MKYLLGSLLLLAMFAIGNAQKVVVAYVPNWIDLNAFSQTIDFGKVTHVNVAFENPSDDEGNFSFNPQNDFLIAKARENKVKVLLSIGGGGMAEDKAMMARYFSLISAPRRAAFVEKLAAYLKLHKFDGLDVDLEGPSINEDYGAFVDELGKVLKRKKLLLTAAVSQGYGGDRIPSTVFKQFDLVNIMAYDGTGAWDPNRPGQHSSYDYAKSNVAYWVSRGLPKAKAVLGVPFYGYGFGTAYKNDGYTYAEIVAAYPGADQLDQVGSTIWYNGIPTMQAKAKYIIDEGLAGAMIWSLDQDVKGDSSLLSALYKVFHP